MLARPVLFSPRNSHIIILRGDVSSEVLYVRLKLSYSGYQVINFTIVSSTAWPSLSMKSGFLREIRTCGWDGEKRAPVEGAFIDFKASHILQEKAGRLLPQ